MDRWLTPEQQQAWRGLQMMDMRLNAELARRLCASTALSYPDYAVLVALTDDPQGRSRQNELATSLGWEKSRLSHHIRRMEARDLVTREDCASDRRGTFVVITDHGRQEIEAAAPGHVEAVRELFIDRLSEQQLATLAAITGTILEGLDEMELTPPCEEDSDTAVA